MNAQEILDKLKHFKYGDTHQAQEVETILEFSKRLPPNPTILETGTLVGKSACSWAMATGGTVYTIEFNDTMKETIENVKSVGLEGRVIPIRGDSTKIRWSRMVDVVWLDSDHSRHTVIQELKKYEPFARKLICGHDYNHPDFPEVKPAVDSWFGTLDNPQNVSIWHKWVDTPMVDVVSLFIGRTYCVDQFLKGLEDLDYPKKRMNLIWHDTSHIPQFSARLEGWLRENAPLYNSVVYLQCKEPHFHFEEVDGAAPKAMWQIVEAYNHSKCYLKGDYMLALEDDVVGPPDGLRKLLNVVKGDCKGACGLNIYRPSIDRFQGKPIIWTFNYKSVFPGENIEKSWQAVIWTEEAGQGVEFIGSGHLGFTLIDGDWIRKNQFKYNIGSISGCDTLLGFQMMEQGFKYAIDWSIKCKHYDIDGNYV